MQQLDLSPVQNHDAFAVAVSGGGDSMALAHMLAHALPHKTIHALTVDHALRSESAAEAAAITAWLAPLPNVRHRILRWNDTKPDSRIMESARTARYALMAEYCRAHALPVLAVAHHGDDQRETFFMRLVRGTGLDGLAAMRPLKPYDDALALWRPVLGYSHADLIAYCRGNALKWVEDPSNHNENYTRVRLRALNDALNAEGLTIGRLSATTHRIARAAAALEELTARLYDTARLPSDAGIAFRFSALKAEPEELVIRLLRRALSEQGRGGAYGARYDKIEQLASACMAAQGMFKTTLGGCVIAANPARDTLEINPEK